MRKVTRAPDGKPLFVTVRSTRTHEWSTETMWSLASTRDNGASYFLVRSDRTVRDLERLFRQREVAIMLEEQIGGIVQDEGLEPPFLFMQIDLRGYETDESRELLDLCLSEIGVRVVGIAPINPMTHELQ